MVQHRIPQFRRAFYQIRPARIVRVLGPVAELIVKTPVLGRNQGRHCHAEQYDDSPPQQGYAQRPLGGDSGGQPGKDHCPARGYKLDNQNSCHVEHQGNAQGFGGKGAGNCQHRLDSVVEQQVGSQIGDDYLELAQLPDRLAQLAKSQRNGPDRPQTANLAGYMRLRHYLQGPPGPTEPPDADRSDGDAGDQVGVVCSAGSYNQYQVRQQQQPAANVPVGKPPAAHLVHQVPGRNVGQQGVVENQAAGKAHGSHNEHPEEPKPRVGGIGREEHQNGEKSPRRRIDTEQGLFDRHPVGDDAQYRAG